MNRLNRSDVIEIIRLALKEDLGGGDITSNAIFSGNELSEAVIIAKENGIFCGGDMACYIYEEIDNGIHVAAKIADGGAIRKGDIAVKINGPARNILAGERTVLNFIQRMSGIATKTKRICSMLESSGVRLLDTRKTMPGQRLIDKYSVRMGGGTNHRIGLFDMIMIKDNHIKAAGSITEAVERVKKLYGGKFRIEVESANLEEVRESLSSGADIIMLDNMDKTLMKNAIEIIDGKAEIEISGNMDEEKINDILDLKVDYVSMGSITHSVKAFDLSMTFR